MLKSATVAAAGLMAFTFGADVWRQIAPAAPTQPETVSSLISDTFSAKRRDKVPNRSPYAGDPAANPELHSQIDRGYQKAPYIPQKHGYTNPSQMDLSVAGFRVIFANEARIANFTLNLHEETLATRSRANKVTIPDDLGTHFRSMVTRTIKEAKRDGYKCGFLTSAIRPPADKRQNISFSRLLLGLPDQDGDTALLHSVVRTASTPLAAKDKTPDFDEASEMLKGSPNGHAIVFYGIKDDKFCKERHLDRPTDAGPSV